MKITRGQIQRLVREILSESMDPDLRSRTEIAIDQVTGALSDSINPQIAGLRDALKGHTESEIIGQIFDRLSTINDELSTLKDGLK